MYLDYFGLDEAPFSITPDPSFIYLSGRHRDALAHLLYGVGQGGSGGFVQLTGEVGTGKTTLCRALLEQVPEGTHIALVLNPLMGPVEMLAAICEELGVSTRGVKTSPKGLVDRLNRFLLDAHERGERVVLVIDEAQNLSIESLEQVRLLTNLETSKDKLLQIILLGQPELRDLLRRRSLRQLAQRITARYHLTPLGQDDTARYASHRMAVAGAARDPFTRAGHRALFQRSQGVPRLINIIADRSLAAAFAREKERVDAGLVHAAADEIQLGEPGVRVRHWPRYAAMALVLVAMTAVLWKVYGPGGGWFEDTAVVRESETAAIPVAEPEPVMDQTVEPETPAVIAPSEMPADEAAALAGETTGKTGPLGDEWFEAQDLRAWSGLAAAWGAPEDAALIEATCLGREGLGYACLRDQGTWQRIRQLGLPVVLELPGDRPVHVLLSGMQENRLLVGSGSASHTVDQKEIERRWFGTYLVAWPQAPSWPREIGQGDSGEAVDTVLRLATQTERPYAGAPEFGTEFERWLLDFQLRNGLEPDGIIGPMTLLYLMRFSIEEPRLLTAVDGGN